MNTTTKVILAFIAIFLFGFATGYLVNDTTTSKTERSERIDNRGDRGTEEREFSREEYMERSQNRLSRYLELTEEQREQLFPKMGEYTRQVRQVSREQREAEQEQILEYYNEFLEDLSSLLNESQLERYNSIFHPDSVRFGRGPGMRGRSGPGSGSGSNGYRGGRD